MTHANGRKWVAFLVSSCLVVASCRPAPGAVARPTTWVEEDNEHLGPKDVAGTNAPPVTHPIVTLMQTLRSSPRDELRGKHPRVFATDVEIDELAQRAKTTHRDLWQSVLANMAAIREDPPPPPAEQRRAQNAVALAIAEAALAYKVEKDAKYLGAAKKYMDAAVGYEVWGYRYNKPDIDLAAGHLLFGLGWAYDLLYNDLTAAERERYRSTLTYHAQILYEHYLPKPGRTYSYSQNHLFIPMAGLGIAAYALEGDVSEATEWAKLSRALMDRVLETYSEDGYFYESFEYWVFAVPWLILWTEAHAHTTGEDLFDRPGFRQMHVYAAHSLLPDGKNVVDFGDTFSGSKTRTGQADDHARTHPGGHLHSNYTMLYALARRFHSSEIQGVAAWMKSFGQTSFYDFMSLFWFDSNLTPAPIESLPPFQYFRDNDVVYFRTGWTRDATAVAFKCGPPEGHATTAKLARFPDWHLEMGHAHPDANSFVLFAKGEYLSGASGYAGVPRSVEENTVLIAGRGQARDGQGHDAFAGVSYARLDGISMSDVELGPTKLRAVGHAAAAYDPSLGVQLFDREITVTAGRIDIVDRVRVEAPSIVTEVLHGDEVLVKEGDSRFKIARGNASVLVSLDEPRDVASTIEPNLMIAPGRPGSVSKGPPEIRGSRLLLANRTASRETTFAMHLDISGTQPKVLSLPNKE